MDFLNQATILAVLGYFGFLFKDIPNQILSVIIPRFITTITVDNQIQMLYDGFSEWLIKNDKSNVLSRHLRTDDTVDGFANVISDGNYWLRFGKFSIVHIIVISNMNGSGNFTNIVYKTTAVFYGLHQQKYISDWNKQLEIMYPNSNLIRVRTALKAQGIAFSFCPKKSFNDIFTTFNSKIIDLVDKFVQNASLYREHGIHYKMGILLYGPPGSGKSTIARAIATYLDWSIYVINSKSNINPESISNEKVVIIEDIDCFVGDREVISDDKKNTSMDILLNFLDGTSSPNQCIIIATTNYIDRVDKAILRPGRFDFKFKVDYIDKEQAKQVCDRYQVDYDILDSFTFPISVAEIQNAIFLKKNIS